MDRRAFSAVELIGVLAILAILTALLLPRLSRDSSKPNVLETVNEAHITEVALAVQSLEAVATAHLAQYGSLGSFGGSPATFSGSYDKFSQVLLSEGLMDRPFDVRMGTNSFLRLVNTSGLMAMTPIDGVNGAYDLDGSGKNQVVGAAFVLEAIIQGVSESEAKALNARLDGQRLAALAGGDDLLGRVIYRAPGTDGRTELHIHVLHK